MAILFASPSDDPDQWRAALKDLVPDQDFRVWPDEVGNPDEIEYSLVWKPHPGEMKKFPNLKAIFSLGAGVDHLFNDPDLPEGVPVVRLKDVNLTRGMSEYVIYWTIHYQRRMEEYRAWQGEKHWEHLPQQGPDETRVGILGAGVLGGDAATKLAALHYDVATWSRRPKSFEGVESFAGADQLDAFLGRTDILVCLLPLTPETEGTINAKLLAKLPKGAVIINCARGGHVVDADLLAALESGHIAGATLDVFTPEPLPEDHPFWMHPKVHVTPHMASLTVCRSASKWIAENIERIERGDAPLNIVDPQTGY